MQEKSYSDFDVGFSECMVMTCEEALKTFDATTQVAKGIEAFSLLSKDLAKALQFEPSREDIKEHMAEALIMICQMSLLFDMPDIQEVLRLRIQRLEWQTRKEANKTQDSVN